VGLIYLDACVVIYIHERHPVYAQRILEKMEAQTSTRFAISPLVKLECLVGPMRSGNLVLQRGYEIGLEKFLQLDMPEDMYMQAAALRARFGLKTPDALHLACAQHHGCTALWTNDDRLTKAAHGLAVNVLA
jgi:predicted nucleic acid-binding protein